MEQLPTNKQSFDSENTVDLCVRSLTLGPRPGERGEGREDGGVPRFSNMSSFPIHSSTVSWSAPLRPGSRVDDSFRFLRPKEGGKGATDHTHITFAKFSDF